MIATRNPLIASPAAPGALGPLPLLVAMVAEWEAVGRRINDPFLEDGPEADALSSWHDDLQRAICLFPAGSVLDLVAKAPVFRDEARDAVSGLTDGADPKDTLSGAAWHGLLRDFEALARAAGAPAAPLPSEVGEVLASLDGISFSLLHALEECDRQREALTEKDHDTPEDQALYDRHWSLRERIDALPVGSPECLRAKARAASIALKWDVDASSQGAGSFMSLAKQVVDGVGSRPEPAPAPEPSLVDQILACWREWSIITDPGDEDDDPVALKRIGDRRNALLDAADRLPTAPENVPAKALALAWLEYVALWENGRGRDGYDLDGRLALDIDTAICGRLATKA